MEEDEVEGAAAGGWAPSLRGGEEAAAAQEAARVRSPGSLREAEQILIASCLIRLIHLLSLYREVYLSPKQTTQLSYRY